MDSPYRRELQVAFAALRRAAAISRAVLAEADLGTLAKDDLSPVTVADFAVQALLAAAVRAAFPVDRLVGEESAAALRAHPALLARVWGHLQPQLPSSAGDNNDAKDEDAKLAPGPASPEHACELIDQCAAGSPGDGGPGRTWVFDPIDGTQNFVHGRLYATNVALLEAGSNGSVQQVLSAVGCPNLAADAVAPVLDGSLDPTGRGCIVFAVQGYGTHVRPLDSDSTDSEAEADTSRAIPRHAEEAAELRSVTSQDALASGLEDVHAATAARLGIAAFPGSNLLPWVLRWAVLGLGLANTTFWAYGTRQRRAKAWDHAGAMLLFEEAGGVVSDIDGRPIDLAAGRLLAANYGFVAAPRNWHARVLRALQDELRKDGRIELLAGTS